MEIQINTFSAEGENIENCISKLQKDIEQKMQDPSLAIAYHTATDDNPAVAKLLCSALPNTQLLGCSSCHGAMTQAGRVGKGQFGVGLWVLKDPDGDYGVGLSMLTDNLTENVNQTLQQALDNADRPGEQPELIWIHASPGDEERIITALDEALGGNVPILGGSCADETISGNWHCFARNSMHQNALALAVFFPSTSVELVHSFQSGYTPTGKKGQITESNQRELIAIDGQPAAVLYNEWSDGALAHALTAAEDTQVLGSTTLFPLGKRIGAIDCESQSIPYYSLIHPEKVIQGERLTLFANVNEGDEIYQMTGSIDSLISRAGRVVTDAFNQRRDEEKSIIGGLVIYCAGCMLTVDSNMNKVTETLNDAMGQKPYLTAFTFGEQGCFLGGENVHGNLMISTVLFLA